MSKTTIKGIIFDLDGTLLDTIKDIADAMNHILREENLPLFNYEEFKYKVGKGLRNTAKDCLPDNLNTNEEYVEKIYQRFMAYYNANSVVKTSPYPLISEMLTKLNELNIPIAILSNKENPITIKVVKKVLNKWKFSSTIGSGETELGIIPRKPDPFGATMTAKNMGIEPSEMLYLGDTGTDMQTACNAKMYAVGVSWGFRDKNELVENGAKIVIDSPMDIFEIFF